MAAALLRRALQLRRVLPSPTSPVPAASAHRFLSSFTPTTTASQQSAATPIDLSSDESRHRLVNRLVYRSKQRGFLELDLVLGSWVEQHVHAMDEANIRALLQVLDLVYKHCLEHIQINVAVDPDKSISSDFCKSLIGVENPDLWKWLSGQEQPPEDLNSNPVFSSMKSKITENLAKYSSPETRSTPGQPWVRGWDDIKNGKGGPKYGNQ